MFGITDLAYFLAAGAVFTFAATLAYPTRSKVRQVLTLAGYAVIGAGSVLYLAEHNGLSALVDPAHRDYIIVAVLGFIGAGVMVLTFDLYFNFDTLKDDPAYALAGRSGLAGLMLMLSILAMAAISIAWYQIDPTIFETRANIVYLRAAAENGPFNLLDFFAFALDQTQKALLFDVSEVYRAGIIDIGNNPAHIAFSTACLVYRTFLSVFVIAIAVRLMR